MNQQQARGAITAALSFKASALTGARRNETYFTTGYLSHADAALYWQDKPEYTVYSYATPIAWLKSDGNWHVISEKFSRTTSHHQSITRAAIADYNSRLEAVA